MAKPTVRDLELRVIALEGSQERILSMLEELSSDLKKVEINTGVLTGYVQNVKGGWKTLAVLGGIILGIVSVAGLLLKLIRGL